MVPSSEVGKSIGHRYRERIFAIFIGLTTAAAILGPDVPGNLMVSSIVIIAIAVVVLGDARFNRPRWLLALALPVLTWTAMILII